MDARPTILLVEDDAAVGALIQDVLTDEGYRVLVAATPTLGRTILAAFKVARILTDGFRGDDPWAPLAPLVSQAGRTPVILCSAANAALYAAHAAHGFAARLPKPFDLDALVALVASLVPHRDDVGAATGAGVGAILPQG